MKATLIDYTGKDHSNTARYAAALLIFAKSTRLEMSPGRIFDILEWPYEKIETELEAIARTIPSAWEFVDYTFMLEGFPRSFTHQFVRTRTASFAQQTMRVLDVSEGDGWSYYTGPTIEERPSAKDEYNGAMAYVGQAYRSLIADGVAVEDARGVLPTDINTNIVAKMNLRTFVDMIRKRSSVRVQGPYRTALELMKAEVALVHPWITIFLDRTFDRAAAELAERINALSLRIGVNEVTQLQKLLDELRSDS